jgi:hypothetical protein
LRHQVKGFNYGLNQWWDHPTEFLGSWEMILLKLRLVHMLRIIGSGVVGDRWLICIWQVGGREVVLVF